MPMQHIYYFRTLGRPLESVVKAVGFPGPYRKYTLQYNSREKQMKLLLLKFSKTISKKKIGIMFKTKEKKQLLRAGRRWTNQEPDLRRE